MVLWHRCMLIRQSDGDDDAISWLLGRGRCDPRARRNCRREPCGYSPALLHTPCRVGVPDLAGVPTQGLDKADWRRLALQYNIDPGLCTGGVEEVVR